jgi:hypothetical protein
MQLGN